MDYFERIVKQTLNEAALKNEIRERRDNGSLNHNAAKYAKEGKIIAAILCQGKLIGYANGNYEYLRKLALKASKKGLILEFLYQCKGSGRQYNSINKNIRISKTRQMKRRQHGHPRNLASPRPT